MTDARTPIALALTTALIILVMWWATGPLGAMVAGFPPLAGTAVSFIGYLAAKGHRDVQRPDPSEVQTR